MEPTQLQNDPPTQPLLVPLQTSAQDTNEINILAFDDRATEPVPSFIHSGWAGPRRKIFQCLQTIEAPGNRLDRFARCGSEAWGYQNRRDPKIVRVISNHCGDRLCSVCGNLRSWKLRKALHPRIMEGGRPPLFITLTLAGLPQEGLRAKIDRLLLGFRELRRLTEWKKKIKGGAAFLEIKYNDKSKRWHPHLHIMAEGKFLDVYWLCRVWHAITGDSFKCDIRRCTSAKDGANYVGKYASKPINTSFTNDPNLLQEAILAFRGRRLCLCFGSWYKTPLNGADDDDLKEQGSDDEDWISIGELGSIFRAAEDGDETAQYFVHRLKQQGRKDFMGDGGGGFNASSGP